MSQASLHEAAKAARQKTRAARPPQRRTRDVQTRKYLKAVRAKPAPVTLKTRLSAALHAGSAFLSTLACMMLGAAVLLNWSDASASLSAAPAAQPMLAAQTLDVDFDGVADLSTPVDGGVRGRDVYGRGSFGASRDGGRRRHHGADFAAEPGADVLAPIAGEVTLVGAAYERTSGYNFVEIRDPRLQLSARVFYVAPGVHVGQSVAAGEVIGAAQDLSRRYPRGITNHVHVELRNRHRELLDPARTLPAADYDQPAEANYAAFVRARSLARR